MLQDSKGEKSLTATLYILGFIVINLKSLLSGVIYKSLNFGVFTGFEYAAAIGALGSVYVLRRNFGNPSGKIDESNK